MEKQYARAHFRDIAQVLAGEYKCDSEMKARVRLEMIADDYIASQAIPADSEGGLVLWIQDYQVSVSEAGEGYRGHYAELSVAERAGHWTIAARKRPMPLNRHPKKNPRPRHSHRPLPDWGDPFLRHLADRTYACRAEARAALDLFTDEFPKAVRKTHFGLSVDVFDRSEHANVPGRPITRIALYMEELVDDSWRISWRLNPKLTGAVLKGPRATPIGRGELEGLARHVGSFLQLPAEWEGGADRPSIPGRSKSTYLANLSRVMRSTPMPAADETRETGIEILDWSHASIEAAFRLLFGIVAAPHERKDGMSLHHFTDARGLEGIIGGGCLRLNDVSKMNDPTDIIFGLDRVIHCLRSCDTSGDRATDLREFLIQSILSGMEEARDAPESIFFCSFAEEADTLELWREYGKSGKGFALTFDRSALALGAPAQTLLAKVLYNPRRADEILQSYVRTIESIAASRLPATSDAEIHHVTRVLLESGLAISTIIKHNAYRNEKEWRLVTFADIEIDGDRVKTAADDAVGLKAYVDGSCVDADSLHGVVIGYGLEPSKIRLVRKMLQAANLADVAVQQSDVPVRPKL